jgi:hypothetical protein
VFAGDFFYGALRGMANRNPFLFIILISVPLFVVVGLLIGLTDDPCKRYNKLKNSRISGKIADKYMVRGSTPFIKIRTERGRKRLLVPIELWNVVEYGDSFVKNDTGNICHLYRGWKDPQFLGEFVMYPQNAKCECENCPRSD